MLPAIAKVVEEAEFVSFLLKQMRYRERVIFEPFAPDIVFVNKVQ